MSVWGLLWVFGVRQLLLCHKVELKGKIMADPGRTEIGRLVQCVRRVSVSEESEEQLERWQGRAAEMGNCPGMNDLSSTWDIQPLCDSGEMTERDSEMPEKSRQ